MGDQVWASHDAHELSTMSACEGGMPLYRVGRYGSRPYVGSLSGPRASEKACEALAACVGVRAWRYAARADGSVARARAE